MPSTLGTDDLTRLSDLLAAADAQPAPPGGLPDVVLIGLAELIDCDLVSFIDFDVATRTNYLDQEYGGGGGCVLQPTWDVDDPFWTLYWSSPSCCYPSQSGDDRTVITLSDFHGQRAWQATPICRELFADEGEQHEIICSLPSKGTRTRRVMLDRHGGVDFDDRDRMLLALLRPHLAELHARQAVSSVPNGLTARQNELLRLVAAGRSTGQIAEALFVSTGTVRKHLENIFERLGVTNRTAAVMRAFGEDLRIS